MRRRSFPVRALWLLLLIGVLVTTVCAETLSYQSVDDYTASGGITVTTSTEHPWTYADGVLTSGNIGIATSVSALKIAVPKAGVLRFQYRVSSESEGFAQDSLLWTSDGTEITTDIKLSDFKKDENRFYGEVGWAEKSITVENADGGVIYFAYKKNGSGDVGDDCAQLKDITFSQDTGVRLSVEYEAGFGSVTGADSYEAGQTATLTAAPNEGCQFYGWVSSLGEFLSAQPEYTVTVNSNMTVRAVFAQKDAYLAQCGAEFYATQTELQTAMRESWAAKKAFFLLKDAELSGDLTIPANVTLCVPYTADLSAKEHICHEEGTDTGAANVYATADKAFRTLTVGENAVLNVEGRLLLGAVMSGPYTQMHYQGGTSGAHGRVVNQGRISIASGGALDCWGVITGSGTVAAASGAMVYEPFIVCDFSGGNNAVQMKEDNAVPFKRYAMQNIQCALELNYGSSLIGRCNLYAGFGDDKVFNETDAVIVGDGGLFRLKSGAKLVRTYDGSKTVTSEAKCTQSIGRTTWTVDGGMEFGYLSMVVLRTNVSTQGIGFPIPYNFAFVLNSGVTTVSDSLRVMPGAEIRVNAGATLDITGTLYVYDGLKQRSMSDAIYPSSAELQTSGFSASGTLVVDGLLKLGGTFGGIVQTTGSSGSITVAEGASLRPDVQDGGKGSRSSNNTAKFTLPARVNTGSGLTELAAGSSYAAAGGDAFTLESYSVSYCTGGNPVKWVYTEETVTVNQLMCGKWRSGAAAYTVKAVNNTAYDKDGKTDDTRTSVDATISADGVLRVSVKRTEEGKGYVFLVKAQVANGEAQTLKADESGVYKLENVTADVTVTVTSVLKGDANLDGSINNLDMVRMRKYILKSAAPKNDIEKLAADINANGTIENLDFVRLRKFILKNISEL